MKNIILFMMLFVLTMISYGQTDVHNITTRPYINISFIDDTTLMVTSSKYQTIVDESDSLEWNRLVDEINKRDYLVIKVKPVNKEYRVVLLTYVYDVRQPPRGSTGPGQNRSNTVQYRSNRGQNWENRLQKVYNTIYITYDNGIVSIK
jgi:hypothetical protein